MSRRIRDSLGVRLDGSECVPPRLEGRSFELLMRKEHLLVGALPESARDVS